MERNVSTAYCKSSSGDGVDWLWHGIYHGGLLHGLCISIRLLFPRTMVSSGVRWFFARRLLRCFLIAGIQLPVYASGISTPLPLFMLSGLSLMQIASFTFLVYQWLSPSKSLVSFHSGLCPVPLA